MKRNAPHLMAQAKEVSRADAGPQDFQIQPSATQGEKGDPGGIGKDRDIQRDRQRSARRQTDVSGVGLGENRAEALTLEQSA